MYLRSEHPPRLNNTKACGRRFGDSYLTLYGMEVYQWGQTVGSEKEPLREPAKVSGAHGVVMIAAGSFHALALQEAGFRVCLGSFRPGSLSSRSRVWLRFARASLLYRVSFSRLTRRSYDAM